MRLRRDVHLARIGPDVVLLDAGQGDYFCMADAAHAFGLEDEAVRILDPSLVSEALDLGLVGEGRSFATPLPPAPVADLARHAGRRPSWSDGLKAFRAYMTILTRYHGRSFPELLAYAARHRQDAPTAAISSLADTVTVFRQLLPWAPFPGVCLYRSFFLLSFLRRYGFDATWVFGVQTWPFEAHCWLQAGDVVLDDRLDHVRPFTPILAV